MKTHYKVRIKHRRYIMGIGAFIAFIVAFPAGIWAQKWSTYTARDGLAADVVYSIYQADDGAMWFGTLSGVTRYDGTWRSFTKSDGLTSDEVWTVYQARDGAMWFGTASFMGLASKGVSRFDGKRWDAFTKENGLADDRVFDVLQARDGSMWFGTASGASRYDGKTWRTFTTADGLAHNYVYAICQTRDGAIWFGTEAGVCRYEADRWQTFTQKDGLANTEIYAVVQSSDGAIWVGTYGGGVSRYDGKTWRTFTTSNGLAGNRVTSICQSDDGAMWFGTVFSNSGVSRYYGEKWQTFTTRDGLASNDVSSVYQSLDGAMWFGTGGGGVSRLEKTYWRTFTSQSGLGSNGLLSVFQATDGAMWFGTVSSDLGPSVGVGGASRYDGDKWRNYTTADGLASNEIALVTQSRDGAMWFGTRDKGVSRFYNGLWQTYTTKDGLAGDQVWAITQSRDGAMWFATTSESQNLQSYDGKDWRIFTEKEGLVSVWINTLFRARDGSTWFGTDKGAGRYDGGNWVKYTSSNGLAGTNVGVITQSRDGAIWLSCMTPPSMSQLSSGFLISVSGGVSRYDNGAWKSFRTADGLPGNIVNAIYQSTDGAMWFATADVSVQMKNLAVNTEKAARGVTRYDGKTWKTFTAADGLTGNNVSCIYQSSDGAMWFGTPDQGVSRYDGQRWQAFTLAGGQDSLLVTSAFQSSDGAMWFATTWGACRYDGQNWISYKGNEGLTAKGTRAIFQANDGAIWLDDFMPGGQASRYDGHRWYSYSAPADLTDEVVKTDFFPRYGAIWFLGAQGGVSRYDGHSWKNYTPREGLASPYVMSIFEAADGAIWAGTNGSGVSRYDGTGWRSYSTNDGLVNDLVWWMCQSSDGAMWFATNGGVSRYDGKGWQNFTTQNGLAHDEVYSAIQARDGAMWFGTNGGGVSRYDGENWQTITPADGLASGLVTSLTQSGDGTIWIGTWGGGVSAYQRPERSLAQTKILSDIPSVLGVNRLFMEFRGYEIGADRLPPVSYALMPGLAEPKNSDWSRFASINGIELKENQLANGEWSFYARSRDRYGNADPTPAVVTFTIDLTPPTVVISSPRTGDPVTGDVTIVGSAFDRSASPDLDSFVVEYGPGRKPDEVTTWTRMDEVQTSPVESGILGRWQTQGLQDGSYVLRISAKDKLGHSSEHTVSISLVSALEALGKDQGGRVTSSKGTVDLMVPPNGLGKDASMQIAYIPDGDLPSPAPGVRKTGIVYEIGPRDLAFRKPCTLTFGFEPASIKDLNAVNLAIYALSDKVWTRLGGTVNASAHSISVTINSPGMYGLFEASPATGPMAIAGVVCQPRIISPAGGVYPLRTDISFILGSTSDVNVRIYAPSANLVREVVQNRTLNAGVNVVQWDGKDNDGQIVTSGIYIVAITAGGKSANKTIAVLNK